MGFIIYLKKIFSNKTIAKSTFEHKKAGTNASKKIVNKTTPLHKAANDGYRTRITQLIKAGANVNALDEKGRTPLDLAIQNYRKRAIKKLKEAGAKEGIELFKKKNDKSKLPPKTSVQNQLGASGQNLPTESKKSEMQYFEVGRNNSDEGGYCSDDACPCHPETPIPVGQGYLYIDPELVAFRRNYPSEASANQEMLRRVEDLRRNNPIYKNARMTCSIKPVLVCEQGARLRKLNLKIAADDARHWWKTGKVPLRPTPLADGSVPDVGSDTYFRPDKFAGIINMSILSHTVSSDHVPVGSTSVIYKTTKEHLNRIRSDMPEISMQTIFNEIEQCVLDNASAIEAMVQKTISDGELHTKVLGGGNTSMFLIVSSLPKRMHESAAFFAAKYPPGFGGYLNFWLNSEVIWKMKGLGHSVMAHLLVYNDCAVSVGVIPLDHKNLDTCPRGVLPEDSLTKEDRRLMGLDKVRII